MENTSYKTFSHAKRNFEVESDPFLTIFTYSSTVDEHKIIIILCTKERINWNSQRFVSLLWEFNMNVVNHSGIEASKVAMCLRGTSATETKWQRDSKEVKKSVLLPQPLC